MPRLALAAAVSSVVLFPFLLPYYQLHERLGLTRPLDEIARMSATWHDYLATAGRIHWALWSHRFVDRTSLFPGVIGLALTGFAVAFGTAFTDRRARMCLAAGVAGVMFSLGTALPGYAALVEHVGLLQGIRGVARFGHLALVAVAVLAGFGIAELRRRLAGRRAILAWVVSLSAIALVNLEALRAPLVYRPFTGIPPTYARLAGEPGAVVAEFPFFPPDLTFFNAGYMLGSTRHWRPLVNGYSGFIPGSYAAHYAAFRGFPSESSIESLHRAGVTHVIVHETGFSGAGAAYAAARQVRSLQLMSEEPGLRLYRLEPGRRN